MTPKDLLMAHRYAEAVEAHQNHMAKHPDDNFYQSLGLSFLCLNRLPEALASFKKDNEIEEGRRKGASASINRLGATLWLIGRRDEAMEIWHEAIARVLDGSIRYGDAAGGATQGLLLWHGAVTLQNEAEREFALKFLHKIRSKKTHGIELWPRPLALFVLGDYSFADVLKNGIGVSDLQGGLERARNDLLRRRYLCQALFYQACRQRELGNENECASNMLLCCKLENPILEIEWYLARNECEAARMVEQSR